jgi:CheY-like chemotaxis protein
MKVKTERKQQKKFDKLKILIVEGDSLNIKFTKHILNKTGWNIKAAVDGFKATQKQERSRNKREPTRRS